MNDAISAPSNVGAASMPNYNSDLFDAATVEFGSAPGKTWAGQSDDAFFLDLRVFDLLYGANLHGGRRRHAGGLQREHPGVPMMMSMWLYFHGSGMFGRYS